MSAKSSTNTCRLGGIGARMLSSPVLFRMSSDGSHVSHQISHLIELVDGCEPLLLLLIRGGTVTAGSP